VLIKVLMADEVSTLEKSRVSSQGAQDAQGAHLKMSTLESQRDRSRGAAPEPVPSNATEAEAGGCTTLRVNGPRVRLD